MSFTQDFIKKYTGKTVCFPDGSYCGECLSLAKVYIQERYGIYPPASGCNGARCYWSIFNDPLGTVLKKIPNTPELIPKEGWLAVWRATPNNQYGHIDIVADNKATKDNFNGFDANWGGRQAHLVVHDYSNIDGFLAPLNESEGNNMADDMMEVSKTKFAELVGKSDKYDKFVKAGYDSAEKIIKETADLKKQISDYGKKINDQYEIMLGLREDLKTCESQLQETPSVEEYTQGFAPTGRTISQVQGDLAISTTYKVKE